MRPLLLSLGLLAGCGALEREVSERFLTPRQEWLAEPSDLGLAYEEIELETGPGTSVHGWFVPAAGGDGRAVLLCHGDAANISFYHPYYSFLQAAGWSVLLFDYRGYGRSRGEPSVEALFGDAEAMLAHLLAREDVDGDKVALYGLSLGAIVALRVAARHPEVAAVVAENASSPRAALAGALGSFGGWLVRALALPGGLEPADNAAEIERPTLFLSGVWDSALGAHLAAFAAAAGPAACWVMPDAGHAPHPLLAHDGEYQAQVARFLDAAIQGRAPRVEVLEAELEDGVLRARLGRRDLDEIGSLPVELTVIDPAGAARFERRWMVAAEELWELPCELEPASVSAWPYLHVHGAPASGSWSRAPGPLAAAEPPHDALLSSAALVAESLDPLASSRGFLELLADYEARAPFPPQLEAELVPAYLVVGRALIDSSEPLEREAGRALLERCVAAAPRTPELHCWPSWRYVAGFRHQDAVAEAAALLARQRP